MDATEDLCILSATALVLDHPYGSLYLVHETTKKLSGASFAECAAFLDPSPSHRSQRRAMLTIANPFNMSGWEEAVERA